MQKRLPRVLTTVASEDHNVVYLPSGGWVFCSVLCRYLVLEKLKSEDAQRSHVFSSFFYKRLNQRERRSLPDTTHLP